LIFERLAGSSFAGLAISSGGNGFTSRPVLGAITTARGDQNPATAIGGPNNGVIVPLNGAGDA